MIDYKLSLVGYNHNFKEHAQQFQAIQFLASLVRAISLVMQSGNKLTSLSALLHAALAAWPKVPHWPEQRVVVAWSRVMDPSAKFSAASLHVWTALTAFIAATHNCSRLLLLLLQKVAVGFVCKKVSKYDISCYESCFTNKQCESKLNCGYDFYKVL